MIIFVYLYNIYTLKKLKMYDSKQISALNVHYTYHIFTNIWAIQNQKFENIFMEYYRAKTRKYL